MCNNIFLFIFAMKMGINLGKLSFQISTTWGGGGFKDDFDYTILVVIENINILR